MLSRISFHVLIRQRGVTKGIVPVLRLYKDGFVNHFENDNSISVSKNNLIYFNAIPWDDIYEIVLSNTNDSSMYAISNKRSKLNLNSALLWHCRLGHISKKHTEKLQQDGLLDSTDFEKCVTCMSELPLTRHNIMDYAFEFAARILNMVLTKKVDKTPYEVWHEQAPKMSYLKVCECEALVKRDTLTKPDKLEPRALKCIFVGYLEKTMGYSFYYPPENKVIVARNVEFFENDVIDHDASGSLEVLKIIQEEDTHPSLDTNLDHERMIKKLMNLKVISIPFVGDLGEPANYKAALLDPESDKWLNAMNVEMRSMKDNEVWRIDYEETFSPVADFRAIRILIAIVAFYDNEIWQLDVKTAFLNGYLNEEVYMEQPEASGIYVTFLILYIDDILIMGNNIPMLQDVKSYLRGCFAMKDLGEAAYILGIKIYQDISKLLTGLCQSTYIKKILKRYYIENSKRGTIPMQEKLEFSKSQCASTPAKIRHKQNIPYALAVGSIIDAHWTAVKNILKYIRNTKDMFFVYKGAIDWKSTKQSIFATSSTDAEYISAFDASKEAAWIRKFIYGLGAVPTIEEPINMYCDNTGAIAIAKDHRVTKGARHFRVKVYYLRETKEMGDVKIEKVDTDENLVDPFTKALAFPKHFELTEKIGMMPASSLV
nr:hypothetical protein [Tanacetum cinerariifolium]